MKNRNGQIVVVLGLSLLLLAGITYYLKIISGTETQLKRIDELLSLQALAANIENRLQSILVKNPPNCTTDVNQINAILKRMDSEFNELDNNKKIIEIKNTDTCLVTKQEQRKINYEITIRKITTTDMKILSHDIELDLKLTGKTYGRTLNRNFKYKVGVSTLGSYSVVFTGNNSNIISTPSNATVEFHGKVFLGKGSSSSSRIPELTNVTFFDTFYTQSNMITVNDLKKFSAGFNYKKGIIQNVYNEVPNLFLSDTGWNQLYDYSNLYKEGMYPIPYISGKTIAAGTTPSDEEKAQYTSVRKIVDDSKFDVLCNAPLSGKFGPFFPLVYTRPTDNLNIDFDSDNDFFCGMVRAKTLTINTSLGKEYALIGLFFVDNIVVNGGGKVYIYHPFDNSNIEYRGAASMKTQDHGLVMAFSHLASSTASNFYLPLLKPNMNWNNYRPKNIDQNGSLESCSTSAGSSSPPCLAGALLWKETVNKIKYENIPIDNATKNNYPDVLYYGLE